MKSEATTRSRAPHFTAIFVWMGLVLALAFFNPVHAATTPTSDFTDNNDGTVTHKTTGLTWKRCAEGMTWSGSTCTGTSQTYTWAQATALTATFAGKSDWRLPNVRELLTIVEMGASYPAINGTISSYGHGRFLVGFGLCRLFESVF